MSNVAKEFARSIDNQKSSLVEFDEFEENQSYMEFMNQIEKDKTAKKKFRGQDNDNSQEESKEERTEEIHCIVSLEGCLTYATRNRGAAKAIKNKQKEHDNLTVGIITKLLTKKDAELIEDFASDNMIAEFKDGYEAWDHIK